MGSHRTLGGNIIQECYFSEFLLIYAKRLVVEELPLKKKEEKRF